MKIEAQKQQDGLQRWLPVVLGLFLLAITALVAWYSYQVFQNQVHDSLDHKVSDTITEMEKIISQDINVLHGLQGLFYASQSVERLEFNEYINNLNIATNHPSIYSIAYAEKVLDADKDIFIENLRHDTSLVPEGYPLVSIYPEIKKDHYYLSKYCYPEISNGAGLGYDLSSSSQRLQALQKAIDQNAVVSTGRINLTTDNSQGFLIMAPLYKNGVSVDTIEQRRESIVGLVVFTFKVDVFFKNLMTNSDIERDNLGFKVYDVTDTDVLLAANLIYDVPLTGDQLTADADLNFAGRHFKIMVAVPKNYSLENYESYVPMGVVVIGTIVSLLVVYVTYLLLLSRSRAMQLSEKSMQNLRESEGKFRAVIEAAKDAILIVNEQNNIILWNKAAENLFGYKESEALGQPWQIIFAGKPTDLVIKNIMKAVSTQSSNLKDETFEILTKAKDGKKMNTEASISIARIDNRWHYICILRNITAKKKAEEELLTRSQELEKLNSLMLGREEKMIELKKQLEALQNKK